MSPRLITKPINKKTVQSDQSMTYKTLSGLFWLFSSIGVQSILQGLILIVMSRLLDPKDFGLVGATSVILGFSSIFSQLGIGPAIIQYPALETRHIRTGFTFSLFFGMFMTGLVSLAAPFIADFFRMGGLVLILRVMSLIFIIQGASVVAESLLQREMHYRSLAGIQIISYSVGYGGVGIGLGLLNFGVWSLVGANLAQAFLNTVILHICKSHSRLPQFDRSAMKDLMYFGGGHTLSRIGNYIAGQGDNLIAGRYLGATALGLYGRAYQIVGMPITLFAEALNRVLFSAMAKVQNDPKRLKTSYRQCNAIIALIILPISAFMFILAPEIVDIFLGPKWMDIIPPLRVLTMGMLFRTSSKISDSLARATGSVYLRAWRQGIYATAVIGGAWVGKHWGISGIAFGVLVAMFINFILMAQLSLKIISMTWVSFLKAYLPATLFSSVIFTEVWGLTKVMRDLTMPGSTILITILFVVGITLLIILYLRPRFILGQDGIWMMDTSLAFVSERFKIFRFVKNI